jgi:hypothetical protein
VPYGVAFYGGLRRGEIQRLHWVDVARTDVALQTRRGPYGVRRSEANPRVRAVSDRGSLQPLAPHPSPVEFPAVRDREEAVFTR